MSRLPDSRSLANEALHNLQVLKWWTRIIVYPGVSLLIPADILLLHFPLLESVLSHLGGYVVATVGIEFGFANSFRLRKEAEYPGILARALGAPTNLRDACQKAVRALVELLRADSALLALLRRDSMAPEVLVEYGAPPGAVRFNAETAPALDLYRRCIKSRSPLVEPIPPSHRLFAMFGPDRCLFFVPIVSVDKVVGVLSIIGPRKHPELRDRKLLTALASVLGLTLDNVRLYNHEYQGMLYLLCSALDERDQVTDGHSRRVAAFSVAVARELNLAGDYLLDVERAGILHDIGKLAVPDGILSKPGPLTPEEWQEMRRHPDVGYQLVRDVPFLGRAAEIVYAHHERFDGTGYPRAIKGEDIPLGARIFAVVDTYDAITSDRPYRLARPHEYALEEIRRHAGTQFDPMVVAAFLTAVKRGLIDPGVTAGYRDALFTTSDGDHETPSPQPEAYVAAS
jgi:putative nucleotidyltransferase with HDIG domain